MDFSYATISRAKVRPLRWSGVGGSDLSAKRSRRASHGCVVAGAKERAVAGIGDAITATQARRAAGEN